MMGRLRITVNEYYLYQNDLVEVIGVGWGKPGTPWRYHITWTDQKGEHHETVEHAELSAAPTIERLYHDYRTALDVICNQANRIEALEAQQTLFQQVMQASANYVGRFEGGRLTLQGAQRKMAEEYAEFQIAIEYHELSKLSDNDDTGLYSSIKSTEEHRKEAAQELVDLLVTIGGFAASSGLTWDDIEQAARDTLDKLDTRTTDTHAWNPDTLTVERIGKVKP
jgi:hypothetical protein